MHLHRVITQTEDSRKYSKSSWKIFPDFPFLPLGPLLRDSRSVRKQMLWDSSVLFSRTWCENSSERVISPFAYSNSGLKTFAQPGGTLIKCYNHIRKKDIILPFLPSHIVHLTPSFILAYHLWHKPLLHHRVLYSNPPPLQYSYNLYANCGGVVTGVNRALGLRSWVRVLLTPTSEGELLHFIHLWVGTCSMRRRGVTPGTWLPLYRRPGTWHSLVPSSRYMTTSPCSVIQVHAFPLYHPLGTRLLPVPLSRYIITFPCTVIQVHDISLYRHPGKWLHPLVPSSRYMISLCTVNQVHDYSPDHTFSTQLKNLFPISTYTWDPMSPSYTLSSHITNPRIRIPSNKIGSLASKQPKHSIKSSQNAFLSSLL